MDIFKIDENKSILLLENGGSQTINKLNHPFNLPNENTYNENGKLEKEADLHSYILSFSHKLKSKKFTCSIDRETFINYHYENSKDKKKFLQVLENDVLSFAFIKRTVIVSEVNKWINSIHAKELSDSKSETGEKVRSEVDFEAINVMDLLNMYEHRLGRLALAYSCLILGDKKLFTIMIDLAFSEETIGFGKLCNRLQKEILQNDDVYLEKLLNVVILNLNETKTNFVFGNPDQYPKGDEIESDVIHELNRINVAEKLFFIENCMFHDNSMKREPYVIKEVYYKQLKKQFDECTRVISELFKKRKIETVGYINTVESIETKKFENIYQKLMLLDELNLLDKICEVSENIVSSTQVSKIVAEIIGEPSNATVARALQFFSESGKMKPKGKNNPFTEKNYGFLINKLMYLGLLKQVNNVSEKFADVLRNKG